MARLLLLSFVSLLVATGCTASDAQTRPASAQRPAGSLVKGKAFKFNPVAEGIYHAIGTGAMTVGCNSSIVINESDVMIVDSHITPAAAWVLLDELKALTPKPVKYVVNTHFHYDHAHGNQVFPRDVEIIGHEYTREKLTGNVMEDRTYKGAISGIPAQIEALKKQVAETADPAEKARLQERLGVTQNYQAALAEFRPVPPNVTVRNKLTLYRGNREIQIHFFGRGHTGGDVVVYLPAERIVMTGDLMTAGLAFMGDGYADEWVSTLEGLKTLDFDWVMPGHGDAFRGKERITAFQTYLRDAWTQVSKLRRQGLTAQDAAAKVDLTAHKTSFPQIAGVGIDPRSVIRMYEVMEGLR